MSGEINFAVRCIFVSSNTVHANDIRIHGYGYFFHHFVCVGDPMEQAEQQVVKKSSRVKNCTN
jgi:hypothetical protein